jgi:hypothetical protein
LTGTSETAPRDHRYCMGPQSIRNRCRPRRGGPQNMRRSPGVIQGQMHQFRHSTIGLAPESTREAAQHCERAEPKEELAMRNCIRHLTGPWRHLWGANRPDKLIRGTELLSCCILDIPCFRRIRVRAIGLVERTTGGIAFCQAAACVCKKRV